MYTIRDQSTLAARGERTKALEGSELTKCDALGTNYLVERAVMSSALDSSPSLGVNPRQLGLMRRQSYDLLATSKASLSQALSLGNLPSPTFSHIPAGQRSVPAVEMNRMLGHDRAFRSISGPLGDGQRTPGGSLVVGAEIFGFGGTKSKDRWTSKSITSEDSDGESAGPRSAASHLDSAPAGWPSEIEEAVASSTGNKGHHSVVSHQAGVNSTSSEFLGLDTF